MNEKTLKKFAIESRKRAKAFKNALGGKNGEIIIDHIKNYREIVLSRAMNAETSDVQIIAVNQVAGIDAVLEIIRSEIALADLPEEELEEVDME